MNHYITLQKELEEQCPFLLLKTQQALSQYTSFRIGGACPLMAFPKNQEELLCCLRLAKEHEVPVFLLGNGSNLLVSDQGYSAFFIQTKQFQQMELSPEHSHKITVSAGYSLASLAKYAAEQSLTGLEFAHGIPGTLGGAIVMNAGAYGGDMSQVVESVSSYHLASGEIRHRSKEDLEFSYRHSLFSQGEEVVFTAELSLTPGNQTEILKKMEDYALQRKDKQPLNFPSAGSTFKRPPGFFAAALIDQCGLKGYQVGMAQISTKHAGFLVNRGGASFQDVLAVIAHVQETVQQQEGVSLELEVQVLQ